MTTLSKLSEKRNDYHEEWNHHIDEHVRLTNQSNKIFRKLKRATNAYYDHLFPYSMSLFDKWTETDDPDIKNQMVRIYNIMSKRKREMMMLEYEMHILDEIDEIHLRGYNKYNDKIESLHTIRVENSKIRRISKAKMEQLEKEPCCICIELHKMKNIVSTCCGHIFGKSCFETLIKKQFQKESEIVCPLCRNPDLKYTLYRRK